MRQRRDDEVSDGRCMIELFRPDRCQQAQETEESRTEQAEPKNGPAMDRRHMHIRPDQHGQPDGKANADRPRYGRSRSEEHTSELQSLMRNQYAILVLKTQ